jgi:hypothetical protein
MPRRPGYVNGRNQLHFNEFVNQVQDLNGLMGSDHSDSEEEDVPSPIVVVRNSPNPIVQNLNFADDISDNDVEMPPLYESDQEQLGSNSDSDNEEEVEVEDVLLYNEDAVDMPEEMFDQIVEEPFIFDWMNMYTCFKDLLLGCDKLVLPGQNYIDDGYEFDRFTRLYPDSRHSISDFNVILLAFRQRFKHLMNDAIICAVVGIIADLLPDGNILKKFINDEPSVYKIMGFLKSSLHESEILPGYRVQVCVNGCYFYCGQPDVLQCPHCDTPRYQSCLICDGIQVEPEGKKRKRPIPCDHRRIPCQVFHYFPIAPRIEKVLKSYLSRFLQFPYMRGEEEGWIKDYWDGFHARAIKHEVIQDFPEFNGDVIYLGLSWDGADCFNYSEKQVNLCFY